MIVRHDMAMLAKAGIKKIGCGELHTMVLLDNGEVWGCGSGTYGQLGNGSVTDINPSFVKATTVPAGRKAVDLVCGNSHTIILLDNGELWGCGYGGAGLLGNGIVSELNPSFVKATTVPAGRKVAALASGMYMYHTMILLDNGEVWGCGSGSFGELGNGSILDDNPSFVKAINIPAGRKVVDLTCGISHTMILLDNGELWGCGYGAFGQLGNGSATFYNPSFVKATTVPAGRKVVALACGWYHTIILLDNGELWGCGDGGNGRLGNGEEGDDVFSFVKATTTPAGKKIVDLACAAGHTTFLTDNGELWGCGNDYAGQIGTGDSGTKLSFVKATTVPADRTIVDLASGLDHAMILLDNGELWGCGDGWDGQLGNSSVKGNTHSYIQAIPTWKEAS